LFFVNSFFFFFFFFKTQKKAKAFNEDEEEQLVGVLNLDNAARVHALLAACSFIFEQAVYYQLSPTYARLCLSRQSLYSLHFSKCS
jgi:hypothetical protein